MHPNRPSLILQALTAPQARLMKVDGKTRRVTVEVPMAMCEDIIAGLQLVAREGAAGRHLKEFLLMNFGIHKSQSTQQRCCGRRDGADHGLYSNSYRS